jgi:RimJ/RimL family protein N-acetyltransferase
VQGREPTVLASSVVEPIETPRLLLRPFSGDDVAAAHRVYGDPEVMRYVGERQPVDLAETAAMLEGYIAHQAAYGFSLWAVVERSTGELVGDAGLYVAEDHEDEVERWATRSPAACGAAGTRPRPPSRASTQRSATTGSRRSLRSPT